MVQIDNKHLHDADKDFNDALVDMYEIAMCLCQFCNKEACHSHAIPRSILALLAEKGKVKTWRRKSSE